jgi:hypothetical protein
MKKIAIIATPAEFKSFRTFLRRVEGIEFVRVDTPYQLQGLELTGFIDTGTVKRDINEILYIAKTRIR